MEKSHNNKILGVFAIMFIMATSPLAVTYVFAEIEEQGEFVKVGKINQENPKAILTERMVDGKLELKQYEVPIDMTPKDIGRIVSFDGETTKWAFVNAKSFESGIIIYDGKAIKVGEHQWELETEDSVMIDKQIVELDLAEKSNGDAAMKTHAKNQDFSYRVIFTGKIAQTDLENIFVSSLANIVLKGLDETTFKMTQTGQMAVLGSAMCTTQQIRS